MKRQNGYALTIIAFVVALLLGIGATVFYFKANAGSLLMTEVASPLGFQETVDHIKAKAKEQGWKVPGKWEADFQANFKKVLGVDVGPVTAIKMCEAQVAADLLAKDENKYLAAMMPCTFAVYQKADGKTYVSMMNLEVVGNFLGGDVATAMQKVMPQMKQMLTFE